MTNATPTDACWSPLRCCCGTWLKRRAPQVLLQLASRTAETYEAATAEGVMEVRRR